MSQQINAALRRVPVWAFYIVGALPPVWFFYLGVTGRLGVEPIMELEHRLGELGLQFVVAGLAVTPLRRFTGINLIRLRRAIGVLTFAYITVHLLVWLVLDIQILAQIWTDILKRPYITIGVAGFLLMLPLALTSNDWSVRKLGPRWRGLHKLVYPAAILAAVHNVMVQKVWETESIVYLTAITLLLAMRLRLRPQRRVRPA